MLRLAAEHLLPGEGDDIELVEGKRLREGGAGGVADREPGSICRDPVAVGHAHAGSRAVPGEDDVAAEIDLREIRERAVGRLEHAHVGELQLLHDVGRPALSPKLSQASTSTPRAPSSDQSAISIAPVSEAGTMAMR